MTRERWRIGRRLALVALLSLGLTAAVSTKPTAAAPCKANETHYFSDSSCTAEVGTRTINCYPPYIVTDGSTSDYYWTYQLDCCSGDCGTAGQCSTPSGGTCPF